ncbi:MAG TPA: sulfatase-like hydrolase/transferase [Steroidobacter sp.]|nr:sulfatase-like hydrolase/transferase [Steroidobacter sp.]
MNNGAIGPQQTSAAATTPVVRRRLVRWWGWLLLITLVGELLIAKRYYGVGDFNAPFGALAFRGAMLVAHFATLSALLLAPVLAAIWLRVRPSVILGLGVIASTTVLCLLLLDTQVYQLYRFHINAGVLNLLFGGAAAATFVFPAVMYLQALALAAALAMGVAAAAWLAWRAVLRGPGDRRRARAIVAGLLACVVAFHITHIWADAVAHDVIVKQTDVLPVRYAATAKRALRKLGVQVRTKPLFASRAHGDGSVLAYPLEPVQCRAAEAPLNIVVLLLDSWRYDALTPRATPYLHAFAQRGMRFTNHYSGGNATRVGVFSLFYSLPGTYWRQMLAERRGPVFMDKLLQQNYDVRVFRSTPLYSPEFDRTVFAALPNLRMRSDGAGPAEWDEDLTRDFLRFLGERDRSRPFFALLFYDSPHAFQYPPDHPAPFSPSAAHVNYLQIDERTPVQPLLNRYLNAVHYVDSLANQALRRMEEEGLLENTVVVVTGDHGQEFNDNGRNYWGHNSNFTRHQTGVPFVLYAPNLTPGVHEHRTTHFDVAPTLMQRYLRCDTPFERYSVGRSLFEPGGREPLLMSEYDSFAIVQSDLIAVVHNHRLDLRAANYAQLEGAVIDPHVVRAALEQRSRFLKPLTAAARTR